MNKKTTIENLYKKSATETSPNDLDSLILAQAKANCDKQIKKPKTMNRTWLYGLSTAAVFVMGLSMIINLQTINDQAILPEELNIPLLKNETVKPSASKKVARKINYDAKQTKESKSQNFSTIPLVESPMPQAARLSSETSQGGFALEEVIQESDDNSALIESSTVVKSMTNAPKKESANDIGAYLPEQDPASFEKQESYEQPEITSYDTSKVIVRNEDEFTPTQKKIVKAVELHENLKQFQSLIGANKKQQAKELLERLNQEYPGYDFRVYYETLQKLKSN
jgi:hypothetical protein